MYFRIINKVLKLIPVLIIMVSLSAQPQGIENTRTTPFQWKRSAPESVGMSTRVLDSLRNDLRRRGTKKLLIIKNDRIVYEWFAKGWEDSERRHYSASLAKALISGMSLLVALNDGLISPDMPACYFIPEWKNKPMKSKITIRQLATHTSGLDDAEVSTEMQNEMRKAGLHTHMDLPGWKGQFWRKNPDPFSVSRDSAGVLFTPGSHFNYSNPGIAILNYAVTASLANTEYNNIRSLLWHRIYKPLGITENEISMGYDTTYRVNGLELVPGWGGGSFTADAAARIGRLMLHNGMWEGVSLVHSGWIDEVTKYDHTAIPGNQPEYVTDNGSLRNENNSFPATTMVWYSNFDGVWEHVPRDAFAGAGAGNQMLLVIPSLNLIVVRFGDDLSKNTEEEGFWTAAERHLFNPVMDAITEPPYLPSDLISEVEFAPSETIIRLAEGSDNWPVTWADDGNLYTAYGDGWGFAPGTDIKLSLGLARISGVPPDIQGNNIRSKSGERVGEGKSGVKASGMIFINGVWYILARNAENAQLVWSEDHGKTWSWADWRFETSFGCPTFLNSGRNNSNARDPYVYIYSPDESGAYKMADRMVMARVPENKIRDWKSYEYFCGLDRGQKPLWSEDILKRKAVFQNPGKCYRSGISYNPALKRYIWCQVLPLAADDKGPRFAGGLGIFEAPEPWGPWRTVYYTRKWDAGPGESMSIPVKWISGDGQTCYLVFSGNDCFSVRRMEFRIR